ncbi:hypothetical protein ACFL1K_00200 [Candidatus Omnitrophota bacterium]
MFDKTTGYIATTLFLFNPTLFYYTTTKLAEASYIFLLCLIIYLCLSVKKNPAFWVRVFKFSVLIITLFFYYLLKPRFFLPLIASIFLYIAIVAFMRIKQRFGHIFSRCILDPVLFGVLFMALFFKPLNLINRLFYTLAQSHHKFLLSGGQVYNLLIFGDNLADYTLFQKFIYLLLSWIHFVFEPLKYGSMLYSLYYPYKLIFIALFVFALLGMFISIKEKNFKSLLLIFYLFLMGTIIVCAGGNVGTMLRHRDTVSFVVFIFAAFYINKLSASLRGSQLN